MKKFLIAVLALAAVSPSVLAAPSARDIDRLTTYATFLGRAVACQVSTRRQIELVAAWMDQRFKGYNEYLLVFATGMEQAAKQQASGRSPDSCAEVRKVIESMPDREWQGG